MRWRVGGELLGVKSIHMRWRVRREIELHRTPYLSAGRKREHLPAVTRSTETAETKLARVAIAGLRNEHEEVERHCRADLRERAG